MKRITNFAPILVLMSVAIAACAPPAAQGDPDKNALLIQADFAGLVMTGVAYSVSKNLDVYNVRPLIPLYDIRAASASMAYNAQTWPAGTVFVSVVDPGVGTDRKSVSARTMVRYLVRPRNTASRQSGRSMRRSTGFQVASGRILFMAATFIPTLVRDWPRASSATKRSGHCWKPKSSCSRNWARDWKTGCFTEDGVLYGYVSGGTGRLGNISFSIDRHLFEEIDPAYGEMYDVVIRNIGEVAWEGSLPYAKSFGDVPLGENLLFVNSSGSTSIAVNQGNFASKYGIGSGDNWTIEIKKQ